MNDLGEKIKSIINQSESFALLATKNTPDSTLLAREALRVALEKKELSSISLENNPEDFKVKWRQILTGEETPKNFLQKTVIKIPKNRHNVKEISYEENDDFFSLLISSSNGAVIPSDVSFESHLPQVDSSFCFFEDKTRLENFEERLILPPIDRIVFLSENHKPFAEKIQAIVKVIDPNLLTIDSISTLLYASLILETENFSRDTNAETLSFGSSLLENGADKEKIKKIVEDLRNYSFAQLLGRALARTRKDEALKSSWTFLSKEDLEKTENLLSPAEFFYNILKEVKKVTPREEISLIFWQNNDGVFVIIETEKRNLLSAEMACALSVDTEGGYLLSGPYQNFQEAETKIRETIKEAL